MLSIVCMLMFFYVMSERSVWGEEIKPRVIKITATEENTFEPSVISVRAGEEVVIEVRAYRRADSLFSTWPPGVLHGFTIRMDHIVLLQRALTEETTSIPWSTLIPGKLMLACWLHESMRAAIMVKEEGVIQ